MVRHDHIAQFVARLCACRDKSHVLAELSHELRERGIEPNVNDARQQAFLAEVVRAVLNSDVSPGGFSRDALLDCIDRFNSA